MRTLSIALTLTGAALLSGCAAPVIKQDVATYSESFEALKEASVDFYRRYQTGALQRTGSKYGSGPSDVVDLSKQRLLSDVVPGPNEIIAHEAANSLTSSQLLEARGRTLDAVARYNAALLALVDGASNEQLRADTNSLGLALDGLGQMLETAPFVGQAKILLEAAAGAANSALDREKVLDALLAESEGFTAQSRYCADGAAPWEPDQAPTDAPANGSQPNAKEVPGEHPVIQIITLLRMESGCLLEGEYDAAQQRYLRTLISYSSTQEMAAKAKANADATLIAREWEIYTAAWSSYRKQLEAVQRQFENLREQARNPSADFLALQVMGSARNVYLESIRIRDNLENLTVAGDSD